MGRKEEKIKFKNVYHQILEEVELEGKRGGGLDDRLNIYGTRVFLKGT